MQRDFRAEKENRVKGRKAGRPFGSKAKERILSQKEIQEKIVKKAPWALAVMEKVLKGNKIKCPEGLEVKDVVKQANKILDWSMPVKKERTVDENNLKNKKDKDLTNDMYRELEGVSTTEEVINETAEEHDSEGSDETE